MSVDVNLSGIEQLTLNFGGTTTAVKTAPGVVTVTNTPASALSLETDGTPNGSQSLLNLVAGTNITLTDDGSGDITIDAPGAGGYSLGGTLSGANVSIAGSGIGTGGSASVGVSGLDGSHLLTVHTGNSPAGNAPIVTVTFTASRGHNVAPIVSAVAASAPYSVPNQAPSPNAGSPTSYTLFSSGAPLDANVVYLFAVSCP